MTARDFTHLLGGNAKGLSDQTLKAHFTLYEGYVKKLADIRAWLVAGPVLAGSYVYDERAELKRREPVAYNGVVLHEMYFENLGNGATSPDATTKKLLTASFGSFDYWAADAKACLLSTHGWLVTVFDYRDGLLHNNLLHTEHDGGVMVGTVPVIVIDAWEHAYYFDYLIRKSDYVTNVLSGLDWDVIGKRMRVL